MRRAFLSLLLFLGTFVGSPAAPLSVHADGPEPAPLPKGEGAAPLRERVALGTYVPGLPYFEHGARAFEALERKLGTRFEILSGFVDWDYVFGERRDLALAAGGTRVLLYSWEPHCAADGDCITFADVIAGKHDGYFERIANSMRAFPHTIYVRPWAEMNADWSPWQPGTDHPRAGSHQEFIQAWRHVRDYFRQRGIHNLKFVFNPDSMDDETTTRIAAIWPGSDYVDVLGMDGYNWGDGKPGTFGKWEEFEAIFERMYGILTELHPSAPVWICEFGSKEPTKDDGYAQRPSPRDPTHNKGAWFERLLASTAFPRLAALVHFNVNRGRDFRFESSADSLRAVRKQLKLRRSSQARRASRSPEPPALLRPLGA